MNGEGNRIVLLVECATETAIKEALKQFLDRCCEAQGKPKVRLSTRELGSRLLRPKEVADLVQRNLPATGVLGVVALIDVLVAGRPQQFPDAAAAIQFLEHSAGTTDPRFRAHAAQHDFEAWLLPYWQSICTKLKRQQKSPGANPEQVNHLTPPSKYLKELYRLAGRTYDKPRDAHAILEGKDLTVSANACPQFKAFLNSLLDLAGCTAIP